MIYTFDNDKDFMESFGIDEFKDDSGIELPKEIEDNFDIKPKGLMNNKFFFDMYSKFITMDNQN